MKAYNEKLIRWRKAASAVLPLHKSPILVVIIHLGEEEETSEAAGKENLSEYMCSVSAFMAVGEKHLLQFSPVLI